MQKNTEESFPQYQEVPSGIEPLSQVLQTCA